MGKCGNMNRVFPEHKERQKLTPIAHCYSDRCNSEVYRTHKEHTEIPEAKLTDVECPRCHHILVWSMVPHTSIKSKKTR